MPSSKQVSTHVPSGLFELVPSDEKWISVSETPGTPLMATDWVVFAFPELLAPPDPELDAVVLLSELLQAAAIRASATARKSAKRSRGVRRSVGMSGSFCRVQCGFGDDIRVPGSVTGA